MNTTLWRASLLMAAVLWPASDARAQASYDLRSPDNNIEVRIRTAKRIRYDVLLKGRALLQECTLSLDVDHKKMGLEPKVIKSKERSENQVLGAAVRQKFAKIRDNYKEIRLEMEGGYAVVFRAYNEGVAYRFETSLAQEQVKIYGEEMHLSFRAIPSCITRRKTASSRTTSENILRSTCGRSRGVHRVASRGD